MLIALGVVGINAVGIDSDVDLIRRRILFVKGKGPVKVLKGTVQPAVAKVLDTEINEGVLSLCIDFVISGYGGTGGEQQRAEG